MDRQSEIISAITALLKTIPDFGGLVTEDSVYRVLDAEDTSLPQCFIVLQPGATSEVERIADRSVREQYTLNVVLVTRHRGFASTLRTGRYHVKRTLNGRRCGLESLVQAASFQTETPMPPEPGRTFAAHVIPLQVTYVQHFTE